MALIFHFWFAFFSVIHLTNGETNSPGLNGDHITTTNSLRTSDNSRVSSSSTSSASYSSSSSSSSSSSPPPPPSTFAYSPSPSIIVDFASNDRKNIRSLNELRKQNSLTYSNLISNNRNCIMASDCNLHLNERCFNNGTRSYCTCTKPFKRNPRTSVCEQIQAAKVVFKLNSIDFRRQLSDSSSPEYIQMKNLTKLLIKTVLNESDLLAKSIVDVNIVNFSDANKLLVETLIYMQVSLLNNNNSNSHDGKLLAAVQTVDDDEEKGLNLLLASQLSIAIHKLKTVNASTVSTTGSGSGGGGSGGGGEEKIKRKAYERLIGNISLMQIHTDLNACSLPKLNYCSENSHCHARRSKQSPFISSSSVAVSSAAASPSSILLSDSATSNGRLRPSNFVCKCKEGFTDLSPHQLYPGEVCVIQCPVSYCANGGFCHVREVMQSISYSSNTLTHELYCTCQNWNVGDRCQYSGIIVFSVLGVVILLLMLVVACTASAFCSRRTIELHNESLTGHHPIMNHYSSDEVAAQNNYRTSMDSGQMTHYETANDIKNASDHRRETIDTTTSTIQASPCVGGLRTGTGTATIATIEELSSVHLHPLANQPKMRSASLTQSFLNLSSSPSPPQRITIATAPGEPLLCSPVSTTPPIIINKPNMMSKSTQTPNRMLTNKVKLNQPLQVTWF